MGVAFGRLIGQTRRVGAGTANGPLDGWKACALCAFFKAIVTLLQAAAFSVSCEGATSSIRASGGRSPTSGDAADDPYASQIARIVTTMMPRKDASDRDGLNTQALAGRDVTL